MVDEQYDEVVELDEAPKEESPYASRCAFKGCKQTVVAKASAFRRDLYCPSHQLVFRVAKKLAKYGYGQPKHDLRLGAQPRTPLSVKAASPGRASKRGIWAAAEKVLAAARQETFRRQQVVEEAVAPPSPILVPGDVERTESGIILPGRAA